MNYVETTRKQQIEEGKQSMQAEANANVIALENIALKQTLEKFAQDLTRFQELVNNTIADNYHESVNTMERHSETLDEKIFELQSSNQQLENSISPVMQNFSNEMSDLINMQKYQFKDIAQGLQAASLKYVSAVKADLNEAHEGHRRYLGGVRGKNIAIGVYLAVTPVVVLIDFLFRFFG